MLAEDLYFNEPTPGNLASNGVAPSFKWLLPYYFCSLLIIALLLAFPAASTVQAATFTVTNLADGGAGGCTAAGVGDGCSLREAITAANGAAGTDTITFAPGLTGIINLGAALPNLTTAMTIQGPGAANLTIRRNAGSFRLFTTASGGNLTIKGVTLANGSSNEGGAISANSLITVEDVVFDGNTASARGGALFLDDAEAIIRRSRFTNNSAGQGGAIYVGFSSEMTVESAAFISNQATTADINEPGGNGGGGGAIFKTNGDIEGMTVYINNATFFDNKALNSKGGAIFTREQSGFNIASSTIFGNTALRGGGIYNSEDESNLVLKNTILAGNDATATTGPDANTDDIRGKIFSGRYNLVQKTTGIIGELDASDITNVSPNLGAIQPNGLLIPNPGSPAINAGNPAGCFIAQNMFEVLLTDGRGLPRNGGGRCDIGAAEVERLALDLNGPTGYAYGFATNFATGGGAVLLSNSTLTLTSPNANVTSVAITLLNKPDGPTETLSANTGGTAITASYSGGTGVLTLTGPASLADFKTVLKTVSYNNSAATPTTAARQISFVLADSDSATFPLLAVVRLAEDAVPAVPNPPASPIVPNIMVNSLADTAGACPATCTLRAALTAAEATPGLDTIGFNVTGIINLQASLPVLSTPVNIIGPGASQLMVRRSPAISDTARFRLLTADYPNVANKPNIKISGLRLSNGNTVGYERFASTGGGIYANRVNLTLEYVLMDNNVSDFNGGGLTATESVLTVTNSVFYQNRSTGTSNRYIGVGGAIYPDSTNAVISNTKFISNTANRGGAVYVNGAPAQVVNFYSAEFSGNTAPYQVNSSRSGAIHGGTQGKINFYDSAFTYNSSYRGGAIFTEAGLISIFSSLFAHNEALEENNETGGGGGIYKSDTNNGTQVDLNVENTTFSNNKANPVGGRGGAIYAEGQKIQLANLTITNNEADFGGGIFQAQANGSNINLKNSIIAGNTASSAAKGPDINGGVTSGGFNLVGNTTASGGLLASDLKNVAANLGPLQNNGGSTLTRVPQPGSLAINGGNNAGCTAATTAALLTTDQRGFPRPADGRCDIGAVEVGTNQPPVFTVPTSFTANEFIPATLSGLGLGDPDAGSGNLRVTLTVTNGTLTLASVAGLTFGPGDGVQDATMTFTGTLSSINAALTGLSYRSNQYYSGPDTLALSANDLGNTGGGSLTTNQSVPITVRSALLVSAETDSGNVTPSGFGSLSYAISAANDPARTSSRTITFMAQVNVITMTTGTLPALTNGAILEGRCVGGVPTLTLNGNNLTPALNSAGLVLNGGTTVSGLHIKGFDGKPLLARASGGSGPNRLSCLKVSRKGN